MSEENVCEQHGIWQVSIDLTSTCNHMARQGLRFISNFQTENRERENECHAVGYNQRNIMNRNTIDNPQNDS